MLGADWVVDAEEYPSEAQAEQAAKLISDQGYHTRILKKYKPRKKVYESTSKNNAQKKRDEYIEKGWKAIVYEHHPQFSFTTYYQVKAEEPYWQVKKKRLTQAELDARTKAVEQEIRKVEVETKKKLVEDPWGPIKAFFMGLFKPVDLTEYLPQLPEMEIPGISETRMPGRPRSDIERAMVHYGITREEALDLARRGKLRLPPRGIRRYGSLSGEEEYGDELI